MEFKRTGSVMLDGFSLSGEGGRGAPSCEFTDEGSDSGQGLGVEVVFHCLYSATPRF